jgi:hypothetical protein
MPPTLDQSGQAMSTVHMGWVNPPAGVTNAIAALQHQCAAWPKTPISNPLTVSGFEDAICQAVTGHALFVPEELANSILQIGTLIAAAFIVGMIVVTGCVVVILHVWSRLFGPQRTPKPAKTPPDALTSVVLIIGWFGWLSAAGLVAHYSLGWTGVFLAATLMWIFVAPHLVLLLRNKTA